MRSPGPGMAAAAGAAAAGAAAAHVEPHPWSTGRTLRAVGAERRAEKVTLGDDHVDDEGSEDEEQLIFYPAGDTTYEEPEREDEEEDAADKFQLPGPVGKAGESRTCMQNRAWCVAARPFPRRCFRAQMHSAVDCVS